MRKPSLKHTSPATATLRIIAERAGVSRETVSHVLRDGKLAQRYRESTRERIRQIAQELHYQPHRAAQIMKSGRSNLIAIVHFGAGIEAVHKTNLALSRVVSEQGYDYLAIDMNWYGGSVERTLQEIIRARAEGVLISHIQRVFENEHVAMLTEAGIPVVSVNGERRTHAPLIYSNAGKAFHELTSHLLEAGHRCLLHLNNTYSSGDVERAPVSAERPVGFRNAVEAIGGTCITLKEKAFFQQWQDIFANQISDEAFGIIIEQEPRQYTLLEKPVYQFCRKLFKGRNLPDAILCLNDYYALEAIAAGLECAVRIPEDIAVTGYDNDRIGTFPAFGITTVEQNIDQICARAIEVLIQKIRDPEIEIADQAFDSKLIIRTSGQAKARIPV